MLAKNIIGAAMAAMALVAVAAAATRPAEAAGMPLRIEVPGASNLQYFTLWVALGAGFFAQEGLEPQLLVAAKHRDAGRLLVAGEADVAVLPPPIFLGMMAEEQPILLFASLLANEPINLVVRKEVAEARGISAEVPLAQRLRAMKGLKIGVAFGPPPRLQALFAAAGIGVDEIDAVGIRGPEQVAAFAAGEVDALFAHTPYLETVLVKHGAVLVADLSAGEVGALAEGQVHALATTRARAAAQPELIAAATRAILRAERLIHSDRAASIEAVLASGVKGLERPLVETIAAIYSPAVPGTPAISVAGIERDAELYPAHPRAPDFTRVKAADFVAAQFAADAEKAER